MTNDEIIAAAVRLIKAGKREAAQSILDPFLLQNPNHIPGWIWKAETFPSYSEKIKVLEDCLRHNPGNLQVTQALNALRIRAGQSSVQPSAAPFASSTSPAPKVSPFVETSSQKPSPFISTDQPAVQKPPPPFTVSPFTTEAESFPAPQMDSRPKITLNTETKPESEKTTVEKTAAKKQSSERNALIAIIGSIVLFFLLAGGYAGFGFYVNGQINQAFAAGNCNDVMQYGYFSSLYPQGVFSAFFTGYDPYVECQFKAELNAALKAENWEQAISVARQYLTAYPLGTFAEEMRGQVLLSLSASYKRMLSTQNYSNAIETIKQLIEEDPIGPAADPARQDMLDAYLAWGKEALDEEQYSEAERILKIALNDFSSDPARAGVVKSNLAAMYIAWGDSQVKISNIDNAVKYYQQAGEYSQGKMDIDLMVAKAYLQQAEDVADRSDFNRALKDAQGIADTAKSDTIRREAETTRQSILLKYSNSNSLQAMEQVSAAMSLICGEKQPDLPIFGLDEERVRFGFVTQIPMQLPKGLAAETPGQLHYVACVSEKETEIQKCAYNGGRTLIRLRYEWTVSLFNTKTGELHASTTLKGGNPAECQPKENFASGLTYKKVYGLKPSLDDFVNWVKELGLVR